MRDTGYKRRFQLHEMRILNIIPRPLRPGLAGLFIGTVVVAAAFKFMYQMTIGGLFEGLTRRRRAKKSD